VELYFGCTLKSTKNCNGRSCSINLVYEGEALAGKYWVLVTPTGGSSGFTIEASTGVNNCYNVSLDLNFCRDLITPEKLYNVFEVATAEKTASDAYLAFSAIYNNTCSLELKKFVCVYNFQPCDTGGQTQRYCLEDCQAITTICGSNPCVATVCDEFSTCSKTTTISTGGTNTGTVTTRDGQGNATSLICSLLFMFILANL